MKSRTRARSLALQVLYEVDITNHPPAEVYKTRLEETPLSDELAEVAPQSHVTERTTIDHGEPVGSQSVDGAVFKDGPMCVATVELAVVDHDASKHRPLERVG